MYDERLLPYDYWLNNIKGIGRVGVFELLNVFGTAEEVWKCKESDLESVLTEKQRINMLLSRAEWDIHSRFEEMGKKDILFLPFDHPEYPDHLRDIPDPPSALYVKGKLPDPDIPSAAIIGARMCSEYGRYIARQYGSALGRAGVQIVSGLAMGIDGISQKGAMESGGSSFAVMGCGVDICYPEENREVYEMCIAQGGIISEYAPGTKPQGNLFPPRNRIISGLADMILVVEARNRSGTLITVDMALEQGKDIYCVPGKVVDPLSSGCNRLIKQGAEIALSPEDLLQEYYGIRKEKRIQNRKHKGEDSNNEKEKITLEQLKLTKEERQIYEAMSMESSSSAAILEKLAGDSVSIPILMQNLVSLSMKGLVKQEGGYFSKVIE